MIAKKWLINNGELEFHYELLNDTRRKFVTLGGGRWEWDKEENIFYFYGKSLDYGMITPQQFKDAFENSLLSPFIENANVIIFSQYEYFSDVLNYMENNHVIRSVSN